MKYAIIALAFVSSTVFARSQESYLAEICSLKAEHAVRTAKLAKQGYPWAELEKALTHDGAKKDVDRNLRGKPRGSARGSSEQAGTACGATSVASGQLACEVQQGQPHQPLPTAMLLGE